MTKSATPICEHTINERECAAGCDGLCPICMQHELADKHHANVKLAGDVVKLEQRLADAMKALNDVNNHVAGLIDWSNKDGISIEDIIKAAIAQGK